MKECFVSTNCFSSHNFIYHQDGSVFVRGDNKNGASGLGNTDPLIENKTYLMKEKRIITFLTTKTNSYYLLGKFIK